MADAAHKQIQPAQRMLRQWFLFLAALLLASQPFLSLVWAQEYPQRPVRILVPFAAGGPDTTARIVAQQLASQTGQPFIVDNRPGASGNIGAEIAVKAVPDGYTLLITSATLAINAGLYKKLPFDPLADLAPISHLISAEGHVLSVPPALPVHSVKELIALARKPESKFSYSSTGIGAAHHLKGALFSMRSGMNTVHVPYKGGGPALNALMSNEVQFMFVNPSSGLALIKAGKLRALAYDNDRRAPFLPDVPTMAEAGSAPTQLDASWHGLFAPAKTPRAAIARLESELRKAFAAPDFRDRFIKTGLTPVGDTSAEFRPYFATAIKQFREAIKAAGIEPE